MTNPRKSGFGEEATAFEPRSRAGGVQQREVQASVAKTHFSQLLDEVERGATIVVLRHGRPVARIVPDPEGRRHRHKQALDNIRKLAKLRAKEFGPVTVEEILAWRHEGHRY